MAGAFSLKRSAVMSIANYAAVAVVIMLASIVYEFTVVSWFMAAQKRKQDERARRYPHRDA
jgi:hypothetical protein